MKTKEANLNPGGYDIPQADIECLINSLLDLEET
jgi:hypothetical protein